LTVRSRVLVVIGVAMAASVVVAAGILMREPGPSGTARPPKPSGQGRLISTPDLSGWQHSGAGGFDVTVQDGAPVYTSRGGLGLLWYESPLDDFEVTLDVQVGEGRMNSGIFLRVPDPTTEAYITESFEVQIDTGGQATAATGAIYGVQSPVTPFALRPNVWHDMRIRADGPRITVWIDDVLVNDFQARTGGQVGSYAPAGFLGLQNHSDADVVRFRDVRLFPL
jgi:hypothetical protein